jgi:hypothetical protein
MREVQVTRDANGPIARRIYELRYRIYVQEMGLPLMPNHGSESLRDRHDDRSMHFLITAAGEDAGTLRLTFGDDWELELEQQNSDWAESVAAVRARGQTVAEITRLMLVNRVRRSETLPDLLLAVCEACAGRGDGCLFVAGKDGPLGRLYQSFGARVLDERFLPYRIEGVTLGLYRLLGIESDQLAVTRQLLRMYADARRRHTREVSNA